MKWWVRCLNMRCDRFGKAFPGRARGHAVHCPICGKQCHRDEVYGSGLSDSSDGSGSEADDESDRSDDDSENDNLVHAPIIVQQPITKILPRCEFNTRLHGTTPYPMKDSKYWNTYARSSQSRTTRTYDAKDVAKVKNSGGHYAKTGTYSNVFGFDANHKRAVSSAPKKRRLAPRTEISSVYNASLRYRLAACNYILEQLAALGFEEIIANCDDDYPCLLVQTPGGPTPADFPKAKGKLETNRGHWTKLVMACFAGVTNYYAWSLGIPIEMVLRSSFGHLSPSVADCTISYRINVGIVPRDYLDVIVGSIIRVHEIFSETFKELLLETPVSDSFGQLSEPYFRKLLLRRIRTNKHEITERQLKTLLQNEGEQHVKKTYLRAKQTLPTKLDANAGNLWDWLWSPGDASGKTVLTQIVDRDQRHLEAMADQVMQALGDPQEDITSIFARLPDQFALKGDSITVVPVALLEKQPFEHYSPFGQRKIEDTQFWEMIQLVMSALVAPSEGFRQFAREQTIGGLYGYLDALNEQFIVHEASTYLATSEDGYGSDSDEEGELEHGGKIFSKKLITATGMRAIHLAHHCGKQCAGGRGLNVTSIKVSSDRMYYETTEAITTVPIGTAIQQNKGSNQTPHMLFFDMNHCNNKQLAYPDIDFDEYDIVILDHTSTTTSLVNAYLNKAFAAKRVSLVNLVTSGLKNEQGGSDLNTYGCIRIMTRNKKLRDDLLGVVKRAEDTYRHPKQSHAIRRAFKARGFVPTTKAFISPGSSSPLDLSLSGFQPGPTELRYLRRDGKFAEFDVIDVDADGNCLFSAIAEASDQSGQSAAIRAAIHQRLAGHRHLVPEAMFLQIGLGFTWKHAQSKDQYLAFIKCDLVWGGLTEIRAYSLSRPILVFEDPRTPRLFKDSIEVLAIDWTQLPQNLVCIVFQGNHYAALRRR